MTIAVVRVQVPPRVRKAGFEGSRLFYWVEYKVLLH